MKVIPLTGSKCQSILDLEQAMLALPEADTSGGDLQHYFSEGLYARQLTIPADTVVVSKIHLKGQINFLLKGTLLVVSEQSTQELTAPQVIVSPPGIKRAVHTKTEVVWVTVSATNKTDLKEIEEEIIAKDFDDPRLLAKREEALCLGER